MGRFHRHDDGTEHDHDHPDHEHDHSHEHDHEHSHDHQNDGLEPADHLDVGDLSNYQTGPQRVQVLEQIFAENDAAAAANRQAFDAAGVHCLNVMSSPGAGKTALLTRTLTTLVQAGVRCGVVEGDIETSLDADRLAATGATVSLLNTGDGFGGECHLDAPMVAHALARLDLDGLDLVVVENVGNLVCPAEFDVGAHRQTMIASVTEGEDKPLKYPVMFRSVEAIVVNKIDLLPYLDFDLDLFLANVHQINPTVEVFLLSARTGEGVDAWINWVRAGLAG